MLHEIKSSIQKLFGTSFRKSLLILTSGTAIVQLISIVSYPVLTRIYSAEVFGQFALFNGIALLLGFAMTLRYELAIPLAKLDGDAIIVKQASFRISLIASIMAFIMASVAWFFDMLPSLGLLIFLIPIVGLTNSFFQISRLWHLRTGQLVSYFRIFIGYRLLYTALAISFPFLLILGNGLITALTVSALILLAFLVIQFHQNIFNSFSFSKSRSLLNDYRRFPQFSLPSFLIGHLTNQAPIFIIAYFFGEAITGQYSIAYSLLFLPQNVLMIRISESLYQNVRSISKLETIRLIKRIWKITIPIMLLPSFILLMGGPRIFRLILGDEWVVAGQISQYFAVLMLFNSIFTPISSLINALGLQHKAFRAHIIRSIFVVFAFMIGGFTDNLFLGITVLVGIGIGISLYLSYEIWTNLTKDGN